MSLKDIIEANRQAREQENLKFSRLADALVGGTRDEFSEVARDIMEIEDSGTRGADGEAEGADGSDGSGGTTE